MAGKDSDIRYLTPISIDVKKDKYCRFKKLGIKYWTTIVVYKGNNEVSRLIGQTEKETIYSAIKKGI